MKTRNARGKLLASEAAKAPRERRTRACNNTRRTTTTPQNHPTSLRTTCRAAAGTGTGEESIASLEAFPTCEFFEVKAIIRPWREAAVIEALLDVGIRGLTAMPVKGIGVQGAIKERFKGNAYGLSDLIDKTSISVIVSRDQVQLVCSSIIESSRTGEIGDGKIFVYPVADVIRVRTRERGAVAEYMNGGYTDMQQKQQDK
jgi:nitrogen regulatory protein PII